MPPLIFKRSFRVRAYECDAYGHVNHANYLRYMQETAADASAAVGWDEARYNSIGHIWLIRETDIEYLQSLRYGDTVEVTTWVSDFRRVRSRRNYELRNQTGEMVARASTDWVYVDRATNQPASVPAQMIADFAPSSLAEKQDVTETLKMSTTRARFPPAPPPPPGIFTMRRVAEWRDVDQAQHVNNATYLNYMEECGIQAAKSVGWSLNRMKAEGFAIVARRHQIEYRQQLALGEEIAVSTYLSDVRRINATRHYIIARVDDGALVAQARSLWVSINPQTNQIVRMPQEMLTDFETSIAEA
jgi:acyl-CoA thioester hydrolase